MPVHGLASLVVYEATLREAKAFLRGLSLLSFFISSYSSRYRGDLG